MPPRCLSHPIQFLIAALISLLFMTACVPGAHDAVVSSPPSVRAENMAGTAPAQIPDTQITNNAITQAKFSTAESTSTATPDINTRIRIGVATFPAKLTQDAVTQTPNPTNVPAATLPIATQYAIATIMAFPAICESPDGRQLSPDGKWIVFYNCIGDKPTEYHIAEIASLDQKYEWKLVYGKTIGTLGQGIWGGIYPFHWSNDGHYLYLSYFSQGDGVWSFRDGDGLLRLDLFSGKVTEVLPRGWYAFSFSPKDKSLVYVYNHLDKPGLPPVIRILNLSSGENQRVVLDPQYIEAGDFIWSSNEGQLVFAAANGVLENEQLSLIRIDLQNLLPRILVDTLPNGFTPDQIRPDGIIVLKNNTAPRGPDIELINGTLAPIP
jgi:hypothetical protein